MNESEHSNAKVAKGARSTRRRSDSFAFFAVLGDLYAKAF
jgi:hypothetical protein